MMVVPSTNYLLVRFFNLSLSPPLAKHKKVTHVHFHCFTSTKTIFWRV